MDCLILEVESHDFRLGNVASILCSKGVRAIQTTVQTLPNWAATTHLKRVRRRGSERVGGCEWTFLFLSEWRKSVLYRRVTLERHEWAAFKRLDSDVGS